MWKRAGAGFVGQAGWVALVQADEDPMPCFRTHDSDHPQDCVERWATVFGLPGETREQAVEALGRSEYLGAAHHLSDCDLSEEPPGADEDAASEKTATQPKESQ